MDGRSAAAEAGSFEQFFVTHAGRARRQAEALCRDRHLAEDVVAEAFLKVWRRWDAGLVDPAAYLHRVVRNEAIDGFRRADRELAAYRTMAPPGSELMEVDVENRHEVDTLLRSVPERQRRMVSLRYLADLTEAQTAAVMGVSQGTVKSATWRGLARIRTQQAVMG